MINQIEKLRQRHFNEFIILADDCEKKGWTLDKFIKYMLLINDKQGALELILNKNYMLNKEKQGEKMTCKYCEYWKKNKEKIIEKLNRKIENKRAKIVC